MAINFLNTVDFNKNQLNFARIQNLGTDPSTANSSIGQIYFNTTADTLKQYVADAGSGAAGWVEVGSTSVQAGTGIGVTFVAGEATVRNTGLVTVLDGTYINLSKQGGGDNTQLTADLSAINGTSDATTRFLSKDNTWDIVDGATVGKATASVLGTVELFSNTVQTVAANAVTTTASRTYGVQFNSNDQMVVNVPWTDTNVVTYDLTTAPTGTAIRLTGSNSTDDDVTISGTTGQTAMSRISASELRVALTDSVTIIDDLTIGGEFVSTGTGQNSFAGQVTVPLVPVADGDAASKRYVDQSNIGQSVFQGGYNANTNTPDLDVSPATDIKKGFFWAVTVGGTFFSEVVQPGDLIYADTDNPGATFSNWVVVQTGQDIATDDTQALAIRGISAYDSTYFNVDATGWATLRPQANANGAKIALTGGADSGGETTFTVDITALFGAGALAADCIATVKETTSSLIVYPEVTGNGTGSLDFKFVPVVSTSAGFYTAYITHI